MILLLLLLLLLACLSGAFNFSQFISGGVCDAASASSIVMLQEEPLLLSCSMTAFDETSSHCHDGSGGSSGSTFLRDHVYFHAIFDFKRPSSLSLFLHQVCRAQHAFCIDKSHFRVVLHLAESVSCSSDEGKMYAQAASFLSRTGLFFNTWRGVFDTMSSQDARLLSLRGLGDRYDFVHNMYTNSTSSSDWIMQVDADEFPIWQTYTPRSSRKRDAPPASASASSSLLGLLLLRISSSNCDVVYGHLRDRLPVDGSLLNLTLPERKPLASSSMPLLCRVKDMIEGAQSRKVLLYRADYRPGVGNHRVICEGDNAKRKKRSKGKTSSSTTAATTTTTTADEEAAIASCRAVINKKKIMRELHPPMNKIPNKCLVGKIDVEHFKYTWGIQDYLRERVRTFKERKIPWHVESSSLLMHLNKNNPKNNGSSSSSSSSQRDEQGGAFCVTCSELQCEQVPSRIA